MLQDLRSQLATAQSTSKKTDSEVKRLTSIHSAALTASETHKNEAERLSTEFEALKAKHDTEMAQMRKTTASLQREKSDLQTMMEKAQRAGARGMSQTPGSARKVGGPGGRLGAMMTPGRRWGDRGLLGRAGDDEEGETDEWGLGGGGGGSTRRKGPGFDANGAVLSPNYGR